jgi:hypothetical protein
MNDIDAYAAEVKGNVEMITEFFAEHLGQLKAYGATIYNPMEILFKGLLAVPCKEFCRYIRDKESDYNDESLTLTPNELATMAKQRYMIMKTKGTFSNSIKSRNEEMIELRAELNQIRALAKNILQVANDKSPDEVLAFAVRPSSGKLHKSSEPWKQVPGNTTTAWVAAQKSSCRLSTKEPSTRNKSCCRLSPEELSTRTSEPLSDYLPENQTTRNPIKITEDATSATGTHTTLLGTATLSHGAFIGIKNCKTYQKVAGTKFINDPKSSNCCIKPLVTCQKLDCCKQATIQLFSEEPTASTEPALSPLPKDQQLPQEPSATRSSVEGPTAAACTMETVRFKHIASMADPPLWHDTITSISTLSLIVISWLSWWLPTSFTAFVHYQWNASSPRIHQQNRVMKSVAPFATPPMSRALAAWCIFVLGCCGDSPHLQAAHTHAWCIGQVPLSPVKPLYQRTSSTLLREMKKPPSLRAVQESRGTQAAPEILRELRNCSLWKASTNPTHRASSYQHHPSGLTKILSNSATHSVMTARETPRPLMETH